MTYTPYTAEGDCRSASQVAEDIKNIANMGFTTIRSYSTDCGVFENVVPQCQKHGLKVIYGIFMEGGGSGGKGPFSQYANDQLNDIISNAPKDSVAMIIVGNEALFNNYCTASELASYITYVKEQLAKAGFPSDIAVTTTEPVGTWEEKGAALCDVIDVFAVQIHPYFTSKVVASEAGEFAAQQLEQAAAVCPGAAAKGKYITEIGWPKSGNANGAAVPGVEEQKKALKDIMEKVGSEACLFSYQDDYWKAPGAYGVEQSFGCSEALENY
jgi:exo-beta-1,3-glucanase (GH17 family)